MGPQEQAGLNLFQSKETREGQEAGEIGAESGARFAGVPDAPDVPDVATPARPHPWRRRALQGARAAPGEGKGPRRHLEPVELVVQRRFQAQERLLLLAQLLEPAQHGSLLHSLLPFRRGVMTSRRPRAPEAAAGDQARLAASCFRLRLTVGDLGLPTCARETGSL